MIQRKKNAKSGLRYLASDAPLTVGMTYTVTDGPAYGQQVRPTRALTRIVGPHHYYDFVGLETGKWIQANPEPRAICPDCGEPRAICDCGMDGY